MLFHGNRLAGLHEELLLHDAPDRLPVALGEHERVVRGQGAGTPLMLL
jgi:hypothetical protein